MNNVLKIIEEKATVAKFKLPSWHLPDRTEKCHLG